MTGTRWALAAAAVAVAVVIGMVATPGRPTPAAGSPALHTAEVERGELRAMVSQVGTLTYRSRSDGSALAVINQASGVYTGLPETGDRVGCGGVLYRVDDEPVLLLCGRLPLYRGLHRGMQGRDVRQLDRALGRPGGATFSAGTEQALRALQRRRGADVTGRLDLGGAVFLPEAARIAKVGGELGGAARPGAPVLGATSDTLQVRVNLDPSQQGEVRRGDRAEITLPGNRPLTGRVASFGRVAQAPAGQGGRPADATIPTFIRLDRPAKARGLDQAPVDVDITTKGVDDALSVPVTALVGKAGGGYAVEVVRPGDRRELVAVTLGLFDAGGGRVQVEGDLRAGDPVVVPSI